jgi:ATPase involved in DNA replication initiation
MNIHTQFEADYRAKMKTIRARLMGKPQKAKKPEREKVTWIEPQKLVISTPQNGDEFIEIRLNDYPNVTRKELFGERGSLLVSKARRDIMLDLFMKYKWSFTRIAKKFGRDHTSVKTAVKKSAEEQNIVVLTRREAIREKIHDEEFVEKLRAKYEAGVSMDEISETTGLDRNTIGKEARLHGWSRPRYVYPVHSAILAMPEMRIDYESGVALFIIQRRYGISFHTLKAAAIRYGWTRVKQAE